MWHANCSFVYCTPKNCLYIVSNCIGWVSPKVFLTQFIYIYIYICLCLLSEAQKIIKKKSVLMLVQSATDIDTFKLHNSHLCAKSSVCQESRVIYKYISIIKLATLIQLFPCKFTICMFVIRISIIFILLILELLFNNFILYSQLFSIWNVLSFLVMSFANNMQVGHIISSKVDFICILGISV